MSQKNDTYEQLKKNSVSSKGQLKETDCVRFKNPDGKGQRMMFVGNSITLHGALPSIGWHDNWGMAASAEENDYVHRIMAAQEEQHPDGAYCICQVASWERDYRKGSELLPLFQAARDFEADVIVLRLVENAPHENFDHEAFERELEALVAFLNPTGKAKIVLGTSFWYHPGDVSLTKVAMKHRWPMVTMGDLGERDDMKAIGLFEHEGVAAHPGDLGMKYIADRFLTLLV